MRRKPIYVETFIECALDDLWERTQNPKLHEKWDLRFTDIDYIPKEREDSPQRFLYESRIGFGLKISGEGESVGERTKPDHEATSSLKFWSDEPFSLIESGSGYWKYKPRVHGVAFLTWYDYKTRYGIVGSLIDAILFRPLLGWATALSFDVLKLWIEKGIQPRSSFANFAVQSVSRYILGFAWIWHGLVPKLILKHPIEIEPLRRIGIFAGFEDAALIVIALLEIGMGVMFFILPKPKILYTLSIIAFLFLGITAAVIYPEILNHPHSPVTENLALIGLCITGLFTLKDATSAGHCKREPDK